MKTLSIITLVILLTSACATSVPQEGRKNQPSLFGLLFNLNDESEERSVAAEQKPMPAPVVNHSPALVPPQLPLQNVEGNVWRTGIDAGSTYNMLSRIISQNYILAANDRRNLNLATDWDKFFIDGRLFRNRISVSVFPVGPRQTEIVLKDTVEYYSGNPNNANESKESQWLPSPDLTDEVKRIVDSMNKQVAIFYHNKSNRTR